MTMTFADALGTAMALLQSFPPSLAVFVLSLVSGVFPIVSLEAGLLVLAVALPAAETLPLAASAATGQILANGLLYATGLKLPRGSSGTSTRVEALRARLERSETAGQGLLLLSAVVGIPPFCLISVVAGALRMPVGRFLLMGWAGQLVRFAAVLVLPRLYSWASAV
jgi:membrane protein YqaA with SNARE-associated domain